MSGVSAQKGFYYQNLVGVFRVIEHFLSETKPEFISFESENDILEDINIFFEHCVIFEQVKIHEHSLWKLSELKKVLTKFANKHKDISILRQKCIYRFTTNIFYGKSVRNLVNISEDIQTNSKEANDYVREVKNFFEDSVEEEIAIEIIKRLELYWNYFPFENHKNPEKRIKEACTERLNHFINENNSYLESILTKLYERVCKYSSTSSNTNIFTLKDFNEITGLEIIDKVQKEKIIKLIGIEKLEYIESLNPRLTMLKDIHKNDVIVYLLIITKEERVVIGLVSDYNSEKDIEELCKHLRKIEVQKKYVVFIGTRNDRINVPIDFRQKTIHLNDLEKFI